jgi:hypothetical protein
MRQETIIPLISQSADFMAENKATPLRTLFIIPIVVGFATALFTFLIPKIFEKSNELSYSIDEPIAYLNSADVEDIAIEVNGVRTSSLFAFLAKI